MQLSVILPAHDEEDAIVGVLTEILGTFDRHLILGEVIVVDDGSSDGTADAVRTVTDTRARLVCLDRNQGRAAAIARGFAVARGEALAVMDSDGQYDPGDLPALLDALEVADVANGVRVGRADPPSRRLVSGVYNVLMRVTLGVRASDANSGLKMLRASAVARLSHEPGAYHRAHRLLIAAAHHAGLRIVDVPVWHRPRTSGSSYIRPFREARLTLGDVRRFKRQLRADGRGRVVAARRPLAEPPDPVE